MDFKERVKKFLGLSATVLIPVLSDGLQSEAYSQENADKGKMKLFNELGEKVQKNAERLADIFAMSVLGKDYYMGGLKKIFDLLPEEEKKMTVENKTSYPSFEERFEIRSKLKL